MAHRPFVQDKGPSHRPARVAQLVKEELSMMIPGELKDPRLAGVGFLTITDVTLTPDLRHGTVKFALMSEGHRAHEVEDGLNAAAGYLRRQLMHKLNTRITPQLVFKYDKGIVNALEIDQLLKKTHSEEE